MYRINFLPMYGKSWRYFSVCTMVQKVYSLFKHPKLYLAIKVWVLSNQIIIVISCKEGSKAISPHFKSTLQIMPFFPTTSPRKPSCAVKSKTMSWQILYCIVFTRNICVLFWKKEGHSGTNKFLKTSVCAD